MNGLTILCSKLGGKRPLHKLQTCLIATKSEAAGLSEPLGRCRIYKVSPRFARICFSVNHKPYLPGYSGETGHRFRGKRSVPRSGATLG